MGIPFRMRWTAPLGLLLLSVFLFGCGDEGGGKREEITELPDTLVTFRQRLEWLIPRSFESLEYLCETQADQKIDAAINLGAFVPHERFFGMFEEIDVTFRNLYFGNEAFSSVYPYDSGIPLDSTLALMKLKGEAILTERIAAMEDQLDMIPDENQKKAAEQEIERMRGGLEQLAMTGVLLYGAEVQAYPKELKTLVFMPERLVRVIFPGRPAEGSWVRLSPYQIETMLDREDSGIGG